MIELEKLRNAILSDDSAARVRAVGQFLFAAQSYARTIELALTGAINQSEENHIRDLVALRQAASDFNIWLALHIEGLQPIEAAGVTKH